VVQVSGKSEDNLPKTTHFDTPVSGEPMPEREPSPNTTQLTTAWRLTFKIGDKMTKVSIAEKMALGRATDEEDDDIDFDLTPHGAYHYGVSRRHAIISLIEGFLYIEDLGSTNGTRINGFQLTSHQQYRLRDGDEVEFARMRVHIGFEKPRKKA